MLEESGEEVRGKAAKEDDIMEDFEIIHRRSDNDPINPNYNFGESNGIFFYLYDYQE
jgi:hypothetical protein